MHRTNSAIQFLSILLVVSASIPAIAQVPLVPIGPGFVRQTVDRAADLVLENYFDPIVAGEIAKTLHQRATNGRYDGLNGLESLADKLTSDLFAITQDRVYKTSLQVPDDGNHRPTYLLASKQTFSAGEGIAFLLQEQGRVYVIGETTALSC